MKNAPFLRSAQLSAAILLLALAACSTRPADGTAATGASNGGAGASRTGDGSTVSGGPSAFGETGAFGGVNRPGSSSLNPGVGPAAGGGFGNGVNGTSGGVTGGGFGGGGIGGGGIGGR